MLRGTLPPGTVRTGASVAIVGGGISGLATAYFLQEEARRAGSTANLAIIEAEPRLGGRVLTEMVDGCVVEGGPDSFLTLKPQAVELCERLGLSSSLIGTNPAGSKVYVLVGGRLRRLPDGLTSVVPRKLTPFLTSDLLTPRGKARMLLDVFLPRRREKGDESLSEFVKRRLGKEALERIAEPLMAGIYAGNSEKLSMETNFPQLVQLEDEHRSLILGAIQGARKAARSEPAQSRRPTFMSLRGGLGLMVDAIVSRLPDATIASGSKAVDLRRAGDEGYEVELEDGRVIGARSVVLATPAYESARLLRKLNPAASAVLAEIPYVSTATVSLAFRETEVENPLDGSGFVIAPSEGRRMTACTWVSSKWPPHSPPGVLLLRCFLGRADHEEVLGLSDSQLGGVAREELKSILGIDAEPLFTRVHRSEKSLPQYNLGHAERLSILAKEMASLPGVYLTGAAYRGIGLPDCVKQAGLTEARVAERSGLKVAGAV